MCMCVCVCVCWRDCLCAELLSLCNCWLRAYVCMCVCVDVDAVGVHAGLIYACIVTFLMFNCWLRVSACAWFWLFPTAFGLGFAIA